jgi:DNA-cytosine methyltransferase
MKYFSVCSGIESATVAWSPLDWECVGLCDFASFPQKVLSHHYPSTNLFSDITKLNEHESYKKIKFNLLVGGTPCQSFSDAGLNKGMDDIRGRVSLEYARILKEKRPRWFIWENVEGVFKNKHKKSLCEIISSFTGVNFKPESLDKQGIVQGEEYSIAYRVFDSQYFGVPQRRKRIYIVGYRGKNWKIPFSVLFEQGCFESVEEKNRIKRNEYTQNILGQIKLAGTVTKSYAQTLVDASLAKPEDLVRTLSSANALAASNINDRALALARHIVEVSPNYHAAWQLIYRLEPVGSPAFLEAMAKLNELNPKVPPLK